MNIIADENIPFVSQAFGDFGHVRSLPANDITPKSVKDADALLVRSVTQVNASLLDGSRVRFVGTATIGTDHVDQHYLNTKHIAFTDAAGSNANSVTEYVLTAILHLAAKLNWNLTEKTLGIVGVGRIGSLIEKKATALGLTTLLNDPPLQRQTKDSRFISLDETLKADIITLHVPLILNGPDPTFHLLDEKKLQTLQPHQILINTARGPIIDNPALKKCLTRNSLAYAVLDVWENEPRIDVQLLAALALATPHIAGYSLDGKTQGTVMLYNALAEFLNQKKRIRSSDLLDTNPAETIELNTANLSDQHILTNAMTAIYPIIQDDQALRQISLLSPDKQPHHFTQLRKNYPTRKESHHYACKLTPPKTHLNDKLSQLGFNP